MHPFLFGAYFGVLLFVVVGLAISFVFGVISLVYTLAKQNIFFTLVEEGRARAIVKFGRFHRFVMAYEGYTFDKFWNVQPLDLLKKDPEEEIDVWDDKSRELVKMKIKDLELKHPPSRRFGGLRWVGIPFIHSVYYYTFRWSSLRQTAKDGKPIDEIVYREQPDTDYILLQDDVYTTILESAEAKGMVPVNIQILLTLRIVNPYKALFRVEEWLETVLNLTRPAIRHFVSEQPYEDLIKKKENLERTQDEILDKSKLDEYTERTYGVRFKKLGIITIEPATERAVKYVEAASRQWEAEKNKQQIETLADAEVQRLERVYATIKKFGDEGVAIRMLESIDKAGTNPGSWIIPFGPLKNAVQSIIGKKGDD